MSAPEYRLMLAVANVLLVLGVCFTGYRIKAGASSDPATTPPATFDPTNYVIEAGRTIVSNVEEHVPTWQQLDRPKPKVVSIVPQTQIAEVKPNLTDVDRYYSLLMASYNERNPEKSSVILEDTRQSGRQLTLAVGDSFDGYQVIDIAIRGEDDTRKAVVTFTNQGTRKTLELGRR